MIRSEMRRTTSFDEFWNGDAVFIKRATADLIDFCNRRLKRREPRLAARAQAAYEKACTLAVKAAAAANKRAM